MLAPRANWDRRYQAKMPTSVKSAKGLQPVLLGRAENAEETDHTEDGSNLLATEKPPKRLIFLSPTRAVVGSYKFTFICRRLESVGHFHREPNTIRIQQSDSPSSNTGAF